MKYYPGIVPLEETSLAAFLTQELSRIALAIQQLEPEVLSLAPNAFLPERNPPLNSIMNFLDGVATNSPGLHEWDGTRWTKL